MWFPRFKALARAVTLLNLILLGAVKSRCRDWMKPIAHLKETDFNRTPASREGCCHVPRRVLAHVRKWCFRDMKQASEIGMLLEVRLSHLALRDSTMFFRLNGLVVFFRNERSTIVESFISFLHDRRRRSLLRMDHKHTSICSFEIVSSRICIQ